MFLLCSPVFVPQMIGGVFTPVPPVTLNVSVLEYVKFALIYYNSTKLPCIKMTASSLAKNWRFYKYTYRHLVVKDASFPAPIIFPSVSFPTVSVAVAGPVI